jgi:Tol biopolymer transport system component
MAVITRPLAAPALRPLWLLLVVALLLTVLAVGGAIIGSTLLRSEAAIPMGGSAVFAFSSVPADTQSPQNVMTVRADGTDMRQVASGAANQRLPQFSPDGTRIAVRQWQAGTQSIVVMDTGGGHAMTLATYPAGTVDCIGQWEVAWSPEGSALAYATRDGCSGPYRIDIVRTDGTSPPAPLLDTDLETTSPTWAPNGTQLAFQGRELTAGEWGMYVVPAELPGALTGALVPRRIGTEPSTSEGRPRWSPNGSQIAVSLNTGTPEDGTIHVIDADGSTQRMVIERAYNPDWSPDGTRLSFARTVDPSEYWNDRPCTVRIGTVKTDGTDERMLDPLGDGCDFAARFSPDGTLLAALLIASTPEQPELAFHLGFVPVDGVTEPTIVQDSQGGSWQPVAAPLAPSPSFAVSPTSP